MIILDKNINWDWENIFGKLKEVENLPMDWEWEILDEHYNGNFTEYTVLIGEHIYEVSLFTTSRNMETEGVLDYFYLKSLEEYQKEQEERENRIKYGRGGWEF